MATLRHTSLLLALFCSCLCAVAAEESCISPARPRPPEAELKEALLCNYEKDKYPAMRREKLITATPITTITDIDYHGFRGEANVITLVGWNWTDVDLKWDPNAHHGIQSIWIEADWIWTPETFHYSTTGVTVELSGSKCLLTSDGHVSCKSSTNYRAHCSADLTFWPLDNHTCVLWMGAASRFTTTFNLSIDMLKVMTSAPWTNPYWNLLEVDVGLERPSNESLLTIVTYDIKLKRHSAVYFATLLIPTLVLTLLTVSSYWVQPLSPARIHLCCACIFTHVFFLQSLGYQLPSNGVKCPRILLYYRDSMLVAGITLLMAIVMQWLSSKATAPPSWCESAVAWLLDKPFLPTFLMISPEEQKNTTIGTEQESAEGSTAAENCGMKYASRWKFIVSVADRILFHIFTFVCFILIMVRVF